MKKITLITYHHWKSKRRAGFHWLAEAFHNMGYRIVFVTGAISRLSKIKKDFRIEFIESHSTNKLIEEKNNFFSYTWFTNWHPVNLRNWALNNLSYNFFRKYPLLLKDKKLLDFIKDSDAFIFESFPGIFLLDTFKNLNGNSKYIYRVSDDMRLLNLHPVVIDFEKEVLPKFDLVSVPSEYIKNIFPDLKNIKLQYHGINKKIFDECEENTFNFKNKINAVFVGVSNFDYDFLSKASKLFPECGFHIVGPIRKTVEMENIFYYGEIDFLKTIPLIKFSDIALQNITYKKGVESFTDSLKVLQYSYCRLPIVATDFLKSNRKNIFYYKEGDEKSIYDALTCAMNFSREEFNNSDIYNWEELAKKLIE